MMETTKAHPGINQSTAAANRKNNELLDQAERVLEAVRAATPDVKGGILAQHGQEILNLVRAVETKLPAGERESSTDTECVMRTRGPNELTLAQVDDARKDVEAFAQRLGLSLNTAVHVDGEGVSLLVYGNLTSTQTQELERLLRGKSQQVVLQTTR